MVGRSEIDLTSLRVSQASKVPVLVTLRLWAASLRSLLELVPDDWVGLRIGNFPRLSSLLIGWFNGNDRRMDDGGLRLHFDDMWMR
jgi:hypothetical protein